MRYAPVFLLVGCASVGYDRADWEVYVSAALPAGAETLRVCVGGAPVYELGAGNGRAAVTALQPIDTDVRIEVLDKAGEYLGVSETVAIGDGTPVSTAKWLADDGFRCADDGEYAASDADSRLLGVRFEE